MKIKQFYLLATIISCLLSNDYFAQVGGVNLHLDPTKNSGYTLWEPIPNASYRVKILERSSTGYNTISSFTTDNNYAHFDPAIFLVPNIGYQIEALDGHGLVIATSGPKEPNVIDGLGSEEGCYMGCVGTSYAWSLTQFREILGYDSAGDPILGPKYFRANGLERLVDAENGIYVPYWQAINSYQWDAIVDLGPSHPYYYPNYIKADIILNDGTGPWWDAQNNAVPSGKLVSKSMDQYESFRGIQTPTTAYYPTDLCVFLPGGTPLSSTEFFQAMNFFNNNHLSTAQVGIPSFTQSSNLGCILAHGYGFSSPYFDSESGDTIGEPLDDWILQDFYAELDDFLNGGGGIHKPGGVLVTDWKQLNDEFRVLENVDGTHGIRIKQVRLNSILNDDVSVVYNFDEEHGLELSSIEGDLIKGLYQMTIFTSETSIVIPSVLEIASDLPTPQDKDFFELTIAPNPIVNNELSYVVVGAKATNVTAIVFNLNGDVIQSQTIPFSASNSRYLGTVDLTNVATPQNQIRVSLIFQDGSMLQKTGLKL